MSAITPAIPYNAPWRTEFQRYAVQLETLSGTGSLTRSVFVPTGQWWRPLYFMVQYTTIAAGTARVMEVRIVPPDGNTYVQPANASQGDTVFMTYVFAVGVSAASQTAIAPFSVSVQSIPDIIWPPTTEFLMIMNGANAADSWHTNPGLAVEIYTEDYSAPGVLVPAPTPVLP